MRYKTVVNRFIRVIGLSVLIILICFLIVPFLIPIAPLENTVVPERLADADSNFVTINDITVHYKRAGSGTDTLILLHGFAASTFTWHRVMPALSQSYSVIAYDRTGFGYTARPMPGEWSGDSPYGTTIPDGTTHRTNGHARHRQGGISRQFSRGHYSSTHGSKLSGENQSTYTGCPCHLCWRSTSMVKPAHANSSDETFRTCAPQEVLYKLF